MDIISLVDSKLSKEICWKIQKDWLKECIEYFFDQNPRISNENLLINAKEQYTLANIKDTSNRVIPETFSTRKESWTLRDNLLLQMQFIIDISEPFYEQWRRIHNTKLDEVIEDTRETKSFQAKKRRMFRLQLTDGYKTIYAMEMKQIACLNTKLAPGIKILFISPIQVVNHIMMIKPENVQIIGGEVEELLPTNAYENILLKHMNRPLTDNPIMNYHETPVENEKSSIIIPKNLSKMHEKSTKPNFQNLKPKVQQKSQTVNTLMDDDDDVFDLALIEQIEEEERKKSQEMKEIPAPKTNMLIDDDDDDYVLAQLNLESDCCINNQAVNGNRRVTNEEPMDIGTRKRKSIESIELLSAISTTKSIKLAKPIRVPTITDDDYPYKIDNLYNLVTIDQYCTISKSDQMSTEFAIEFAIDKVIKIKAFDHEWLLLVKIKDLYSKNQIHVRFVDEIVADFSKMSAKEINSMRNQIMNGRPQFKMDIERALASINSALQRGPFLMSVQMKFKSPGEYELVATKMLKGSDETRRVMAEKIQKEIEVS